MRAGPPPSPTTRLCHAAPTQPLQASCRPTFLPHNCPRRCSRRAHAPPSMFRKRNSSRWDSRQCLEAALLATFAVLALCLRALGDGQADLAAREAAPRAQRNCAACRHAASYWTKCMVHCVGTPSLWQASRKQPLTYLTGLCGMLATTERTILQSGTKASKDAEHAHVLDSCFGSATAT